MFLDARPLWGLAWVRIRQTEQMLLTFQLNELQGYRVTKMVWQECNEVCWHALGNVWFPEKDGKGMSGEMEN